MLPRLFRQHARRKLPRNIYRAYSTKPGYDQSDESMSLPPLPLWRQYFPATSRAFQFRVCLANPKTAAHLAEAFVPAHSRDKIIIEAFPGPGTLTRALLALPRARIKKIIVLENADMYLKYLQPLEEVDDRIKVYPLSGELWSSYSAIEEMGVLQDVPIVPWDQGVHPQLQFVSHLTSNVAGEQLISQLLRNIPEKHWLFRYGRVPMSLLMNEYIWNRMLGTKASIRCKLSMIAAATSLSSMAVRADILKPYGDHFHPTNRASSVLKKDTKANLMRPGSPFVGINIIPNEEQVIKPGLMNAWDYCLRHLYVQRATPLEKAIGYLAPGAKSLLKSITSPDSSVRVDPKTAVRDLTVQEWEVLVTAFNQWPFAPEDLSVTDALGLDEERGG